LPENDYNVIDSEIAQKAIYKDNNSYSYNAIFETGGKLSISKKESGKNELPEKSLTTEKTPTVPEQDSPRVAAFPSAPADNRENLDIVAVSGGFVFHTRGTANWNTREPYTLRLSAAKLKKDMDDLEVTIYFTDEIIDRIPSMA
jgi:hypothetical protein